MESKMEHWPLLTFKEYEEQINPQPNYQRSAVWKPVQKQMLMDSVLRKMDIPKIYLREIKNNKYEYEIIDGQQRMRTLWEFLNNTFPLNEEAEDETISGRKYSLSGKLYDELDKKIKLERIHKYTLDVVIISKAEENEIADLFFRLNNGTPLSPAEVRNSIPGAMTSHIREVASNHPFFNKVSFSGRRFAYHQMCAQMMLLELSNGLADIQDKYLSKMYSDYRKKFPKSSTEKLTKVLDYLDRLFHDKSKLLNKASTINVYLLISYLLKTTKLNARFIVNFLDWYQRTEAERRTNSEYKFYMTSSLSSRNSIENRFRILIHDLYKEFSYLGIVELDEKRIFDESQKIEIYAKDKGICQSCSKKVSETNWHADHKIPWIKGGKTVISNAQVLCKKCNLSKGDKLWK